MHQVTIELFSDLQAGLVLSVFRPPISFSLLKSGSPALLSIISLIFAKGFFLLSILFMISCILRSLLTLFGHLLQDMECTTIILRPGNKPGRMKTSFVKMKTSFVNPPLAN